MPKKLNGMVIVKHLFMIFTVLLISAIVGYAIIILAYSLPVDVISENVGRGMSIMLIQGSEYEYAEDYTETILDNQTDALMLGETIYASKSIISDAIMVPHYEFNDKEGALYSLMGVINGDSLDDATASVYPRYWHGYVALLKPFFCLFDYNDWKIFNQILQMIILFIILLLMLKNGLSYEIIGFAALLAVWNPATIGVSLQYMACFYVSMLGSIYVLYQGYKGIVPDWKSLGILFLMLGILTSYFDFLTYPLATFGVPLIFTLLLNWGGQRSKGWCDSSDKLWLSLGIGLSWYVGRKVDIGLNYHRGECNSRCTAKCGYQDIRKR